MTEHPLILGIETSCDETAAAVVADRTRVLSNIVASQVEVHARFGGIVPEVASRRHVESILPVVETALTEAKIELSEVDAIAVTNGPGLVGALLVGVSMAKGLAWASGKPLVAVDHLHSHFHAALIEPGGIRFPVLCLTVSGGHSDLAWVVAPGRVEYLGRTRDDAAGEAFDKVARVLGLGYPGGPIIDRLAARGNAGAIDFPRTDLGDSLDFSFSGLKTAVARFVQDGTHPGRVEDIAASFQEALIDSLLIPTRKAALQTGAAQLVLAGGVAANSRLRSRCQSLADELHIELKVPPPRLCTDNAAMVACAGALALARGEVAGLDVDTYAVSAPYRKGPGRRKGKRE